MGCNVSKDVKVEDQGAQGPPTENGIDPSISEDDAAKKIQAQFRGYQTRKSLRSNASSTPQPDDALNESKAEEVVEDAKPSEIAPTAEPEDDEDIKEKAEEEEPEVNKDTEKSEEAEEQPEASSAPEQEQEQEPEQQEPAEAAPEADPEQKEEDAEAVPNAVENGDKGEEEEIDIDLEDPAVEDAALKIQASFRGFKVRKEMKDDEGGEARDIEEAAADEELDE